MRFTLADLKKTVSRRGGEPHLVPSLLRPGELGEQLAALIALFEAHVGRERAYFPDDRPAELIGDYRLARCLVLCLSEWYEWRSPKWPEGASEAEERALAAHAVDSSSALRLALYDYVNATAGGYLADDERDPALDAFAAALGLARSTLDDLLHLDGEPQMVLERVGDSEAPTPVALAARYNQRAVETVLANASVVEWTITPARGRQSEPLGTLVKRACFLARRMGVQYEVSFTSTAYEHEAPALAVSQYVAGERVLPRVAERLTLYAVPQAPAARADGDTEAAPLATLDADTRSLVLTLYGPQELTGAPIQYGERLARLCRALLGYRRAPATRDRAALAGDGLQGVARVYLHGRPLSFTLDERLLRLLSPTSDANNDLDRADTRETDGEHTYDSSLERQLANEWTSLEREQATAGWRLEREPEPIVVGEMILVPDFALRRGDRRIFLEIAGYWRPEYRERKLRKLRAIGDAVPLILAAPETARAEFAALDKRLPLLWYHRYLSAPALLALLERDCNDFTVRLAQLDAPAIRAEVAERGRLPVRESYERLGCYTRAELAVAVARLGEDTPDAPRWIDGVGLCAASWHDEMLTVVRARVTTAPGSRTALAVLAADLRNARPELADLTEPAVEALARQAGLRIARASLFAAEVFLADDGAVTEPDEVVPSGETSMPAGGKIGGTKPQPRRAAKRKLTEPGYSTASMFEPDTPPSVGGHSPGEGETRGRRRQ